MSKPTPYYILRDRVPVPCDDYLVYAVWMNSTNLQVGLDWIGRVEISTVFTGISISNPPKLFETMCFGGDFTDYAQRYVTWEEAEKGHGETVFLVKIHRRVLAKRGFNLMVRRLLDSLEYQPVRSRFSHHR